MPKIGILCAVERELKPFLDKMGPSDSFEKALLTFHEGSLGGVPVLAVACGVGKANAAMAVQILIDRGADTVIVSGTAGAMARDIHIFDTVVCTEVVYHDMDGDILVKYHPWLERPVFASDENLVELAKASVGDVPQKVHFGLATTGDSFIDMDGRHSINETFRPLCVEMETAAAAQVCYANKIPFIAIRSISDSETDHGEDVFERNCDKASYHSYLMARAILSRLAAGLTQDLGVRD